MGVCAGRLRLIRFTTTSLWDFHNNTKRGAAGAVLIAELLAKQGRIAKNSDKVISHNAQAYNYRIYGD